MGPAALVGNDVVDLAESGWDHRAERARFQRFAARVCAPAELEVVLHAPSPTLALAEHFAAKEAAYKLIAKLSPGTAFAHRSFVVDLVRRCVSYGPWNLRLSLAPWLDGVVACVQRDDCRVVSEIAPRNEDEHPSVAVRALALGMLARELGVARTELQIVRAPAPGSWDGRAPPVVTFRGATLPLDVSLSHHGRLVACAMARMPD